MPVPLARAQEEKPETANQPNQPFADRWVDADQSIDTEPSLTICTPREKGLDPSKLQMHEDDCPDQKDQAIAPEKRF